MATPKQYLLASRALRDAARIRWSQSPNSRLYYGTDITAGFEEERLALARVALSMIPATGSVEVSLDLVERLLWQLKLSEHPGFD